MLTLLRVLRDGSTVDEALQQVYGFDIEGFEDAWRADIGAQAAIGQRAKPTPTLVPTIVPTFVPASVSITGPTPAPARERPTPTPIVIAQAGAPATVRSACRRTTITDGMPLVVIVAVVVIVDRHHRRRDHLTPQAKDEWVMRTRTLSGLLILIFMLASCTTPTPAPTPSATVTAMPQMEPSATVAPSATPEARSTRAAAPGGHLSCAAYRHPLHRIRTKRKGCVCRMPITA